MEKKTPKAIQVLGVLFGSMHKIMHPKRKEQSRLFAWVAEFVKLAL